jgi:2-polyprenyl-6-methoxyphenol hydroxylase-like FAD-dependent oxidoreductase
MRRRRAAASALGWVVVAVTDAALRTAAREPVGWRGAWGQGERFAPVPCVMTVRAGALVGDAGYHKNPIRAMGINDAFRDAEVLAGGLDEALSGTRDYDDAMSDYQRARDSDALPVYEFTDDFAQLQPPPPELQQLIGAMAGNQRAMDDFVSVQASTLPAPEFFDPSNVGRIMGAAGIAG